MSAFQGQTTAEITAEAKDRMKRTVGDLGRDLATIRTGRASLAILDPIRVDYYGTPHPPQSGRHVGHP